MEEPVEPEPLPSNGWYCYDCSVVHPATDPRCPITLRPRPKGWRTGQHKPFGPVWR
jgi:hypothetical protein